MNKDNRVKISVVLKHANRNEIPPDNETITESRSVQVNDEQISDITKTMLELIKIPTNIGETILEIRHEAMQKLETLPIEVRSKISLTSYFVLLQIIQLDGHQFAQDQPPISVLFQNP